jgi:hypothetical protein
VARGYGTLEPLKAAIVVAKIETDHGEGEQIERGRIPLDHSEDGQRLGRRPAAA